MREQILNKLAVWHTSHPWRMLVISLMVTVLMFGLAGQLTMTMRTTDLLPENDPKVDQYNNIVEEFTSSVSTVVVIQGPETEIKRFADEIAPKLLALRNSRDNADHQAAIAELQARIDKYRRKGRKAETIRVLETEIADHQRQINFQLYQRVDYKLSEDFIKDHGLILVEASDLEDNKDYFSDPNLPGLLTKLNDSMEREYVGQEESISTREEEDGAVQFMDGIEGLVNALQKVADGGKYTEAQAKAVVDRMLYGDPYFLSYDKQAVIVNAIPNFTLMERQHFTPAVELVREILDEQLPRYPEVSAGLTGAVPKEYDEQTYGAETLGSSTLLAMLVILVMLMFSFRMWLAPVLAMTNLIVGIIWASGLAYLFVGELNMMTSIFSVILFGLGIDFSIHLITGFTQRRAIGDSILDSLNHTFHKSGKGIMTGGLTTSFAFLALVVSQSRGMADLGLVIGVGLFSVLVSTFVFLPTLLVFRERRVDRKWENRPEQPVRKDLSFAFLGRLGEWFSRRYVLSLSLSGLVSALLIWNAFQMHWDYDYRSMEPEGIASMALIDTVMEKFDLSMDYALITAESVAESRQLAEEYKELGSVAMTDDISAFLPLPEELAERQAIINDIRTDMAATAVKNHLTETDLAIILEQLDRLEMNIIEIQDMAFIGGQDKVDNKCKRLVGDPDRPEQGSIISQLINTLADSDDAAQRLSLFHQDFASLYQAAVVRMANPAEVMLADLPQSILDRYANKTNNQFLVTIYPSGDIYNGEFLNRFVDDVERINPRVTGIGPLSVALLNVYAEDGRRAMGLTMLVVFILMMIDFKRPKIALMAMIPLGIGVFWMVGLMQLTGIPLNIMTVMGLPLIIGIGIDDGVHVIHRWQAEGRGRVHTIFSSTGKAIFLTSLTTMLAFGSMLFSIFPAYAQFGGSLFMGVGACFLTSVMILPGLIGVFERQ